MDSKVISFPKIKQNKKPKGSPRKKRLNKDLLDSIKACKEIGRILYNRKYTTEEIWEAYNDIINNPTSEELEFLSKNKTSKG